MDTIIDTAFGPTRIKNTPQRIAVVAPGDADILLALGLRPLSLVPFATKGLVTEWNRSYIHYGPENLAYAAKDPASALEKTAELRPDLIIAINTIVSRKTYDAFSKIAPTIVRSGKFPDLSEPWQESARTIAKAVNKSDEAATLIAAAENRVKQIAAKTPHLTGKKGAVIWPSVPGEVMVYSPRDSRGATLTALGLQQPKEVLATSEGNGGIQWGGQLTYENLNVLAGVDFLVVLYGPYRDALEANPIYRALPAVSARRVARLDEDTSGAMSVATVLSLPWVVDQIAQALRA